MLVPISDSYPLPVGTVDLLSFMEKKSSVYKTRVRQTRSQEVQSKEACMFRATPLTFCAPALACLTLEPVLIFKKQTTTIPSFLKCLVFFLMHLKVFEAFCRIYSIVS